MSTVGIVCEYNPFHKGHQYQIEQAKKITGADHVICFMSGNFLQRGVPALADKFTRAEIALKCGADVIFEIPFVYSTASARDYATSAVTMMELSGIIDYISFGAETDDIDLLSHIADIVENEPHQVSTLIQKFMSCGMTYGAARANAIADYIFDQNTNTSESEYNGYSKDMIDHILSSPNNILAIEYIAALKRIGSTIKPAIIKRAISDYNSSEASHDICSASAIRNILETSDIEDIKRHVPEVCYQCLSSCYKRSFPIYDDALSGLLTAARLFYDRYQGYHDYDTELYPDIVDMDNDLYNRLMKLDKTLSFSETTMSLKCRNYTLTRIQRAILHYITQVSENDYAQYKSGGWIYYLRLLGLNTKAGNIIKKLKKGTDIPVITKAADFNSMLNGHGISMFRYDIKSTDIYNSLVYKMYGTKLRNEFEHTIPVITR